MAANHFSFRWSGGDAPFLDAPQVVGCGPVSVGRYGGFVGAGANKNEDAALVWTASDGSWTVAALLDAHGSSESAELVLSRLAELEIAVVRLLGTSDGVSILPYTGLSRLIMEHLSNEKFRQQCASIRGETALLVCAQKGAYLWWLSIGDIPVYVFHPDFAFLGQFALNQRMFYEWIGQVNTFALPVPCFATGVRQLRAGTNNILMATDGLLECGTRPFENARDLNDLFYASLGDSGVATATRDALDVVHAEHGRDSATLLSWQVKVESFAGMMQPSA